LAKNQRKIFQEVIYLRQPGGRFLKKLLIKGGHSLQPERIFMQTMTAFDSFRQHAAVPLFFLIGLSTGSHLQDLTNPPGGPK
jgi:hypothetical protein